MTHHLAELATRWQRLAERQRDHLLFLRERYRRYDAAQLDVLISGAERNLAGWAALTSANKSGDDVQCASEERPCDEPALPKLDSRYPPARLTADPQEAVAALERRADGQPQQRWPAFLCIQPYPNPPSFHTECWKDFPDAVREAKALSSDVETFRESSPITESGGDAFLSASGLAHDEHAAGQDSHSPMRKRPFRQFLARLSR
jgi:hypothetical protein